MKKSKPTKFGLEITFTRAERALPPAARRDLLAWLRARRRAQHNGHPHRDFWLITPGGQRKRL